MIRIALLGFGVVGSGTAEVLTENRALLAARAGEKSISVTFWIAANSPITRSETVWCTISHRSSPTRKSVWLPK